MANAKFLMALAVIAAPLAEAACGAWCPGRAGYPKACKFAGCSTCAACSGQATLRLHKHMTSNMVVPADAPTFTGWTAAPHAKVSARASTGGSAIALSGADSSFVVTLPAMAASLTPFTVNLTEEAGATVVRAALSS